MSRIDGARQGPLVWGIGLVPRIPIPTDQVTVAGVVTVVVVLVGTLLAAVLGGTIGRRYHSRVDRASL